MAQVARNIMLLATFLSRLIHQAGCSTPAHQVAATDAWSYVAGLTPVNDVSARDVAMYRKPAPRSPQLA
jgi:hypothetical protein